jgi:hypothetical protein
MESVVTPVESASDLAVDDVVNVRDRSDTGVVMGRRGVVVRVGKASAVIEFAAGQETIRYKKRVTRSCGSMLRVRYRADFFPIEKLSAHDIWIAECPKSDRVLGTQEPTLIVRASAVRDEIDHVIEDLRKRSEWLQREPKEES